MYLHPRWNTLKSCAAIYNAGHKHKCRYNPQWKMFPFKKFHFDHFTVGYNGDDKKVDGVVFVLVAVGNVLESSNCWRLSWVLDWNVVFCFISWFPALADVFSFCAEEALLLLLLFVCWFWSAMKSFCLGRTRWMTNVY